ncbi:Thioredoxin-1 [Erysiphe necator]|uniref:Thioredoxin n=1 Tax=Uncinula necator TaxID=52586 RepID=A0A0B1P5L0_UNCNE|nr:Thioredoxin-1 [Erysiphe necator]KHJ32620.1 putative thioredoxin [Erysiphe necator]
MVVHAIHSKAEFDDAINTHQIVVVDAYATWCGPCRIISPVFERLSETKPQAYFVKFDVDEVLDVTKELEIRAMPTFVFFRQGIKGNQITGANPVALENAITMAIELSAS